MSEGIRLGEIQFFVDLGLDEEICFVTLFQTLSTTIPWMAESRHQKSERARRVVIEAIWAVMVKAESSSDFWM